MTVACVNEECAEHGAPKTNTTMPDVTVEEIRCGKCGGPVEQVAGP